jgi:phenylalanyl-tRNA synthetase beta subunit
MSITRQIYDKTTQALPDITARKFSRYCGKSEGYYGSISSQNLDISTNGLLYLSEVLEHKKATNPNKLIVETQNLIAAEIARRMQQVDTGNLAIRKLVLRAIASTYLEAHDEFSVPPILIT